MYAWIYYHYNLPTCYNLSVVDVARSVSAVADGSVTRATSVPPNMLGCTTHGYVVKAS